MPDTDSMLLRLARVAPPELLWEISMFLNGQDLLNLQLTSASLGQWVQHHIFRSAMGMRTIEQKASSWLKNDLATFQLVKLSCKHPVFTLVA